MADEGSVRMVSVLSFLLAISFISEVLALPDEKHTFLIKESPKENSASKLFVTHKPHYVSFLPNAGAIPSNEISSVNSLALGLSIPEDLTWSGLLAGNMFKRPKARIMFGVEGVTQDDNLNVQAAAAFPVHENDDSSGLAGILSHSNAINENFASRVSRVFGGKSLVLSVSGDEKLAASASSAGENSYTLYYDQAKEQFELSDNDHDAFQELQLTNDQIISRLQKASLVKGTKVSSDGKVVTVAIPGQGNAVFDLNRKEDFILFAEVQMVYGVLDKLKTNPALINDNSPDILTFCFSGAKVMRDRYGRDSLQAKGAVVFLSSIIPELSKQFFELYNGNALVEVLVTQWQENLKDKFPSDVNHIFRHLEPHLASVESFNHQLPSVTLRGDLDSSVMETLCDSLRNKLVNIQSKLKVNCLGGSLLHRTRREVEAQSPTGVPTSKSLNIAYKYTPFYSTIFNIWFWLLVVLVLTVYVISMVLWYMDPGRDSIIYRMTSQRMKTD